MRVVITGALGYVGSHLIRSAWDSRVDELVLVDNLATGQPTALFDVPVSCAVRFVEADVRTFDFAAALEPGDVVIHLAALTGADVVRRDAAEVETVNVESTRRIADACARRGARLLFASSTSVYNGLHGAVSEGTPIDTAPLQRYAMSKWRAERAIEATAAERPLSYTILRFGTMFGVSPGLRMHTAINAFCWQACTGRPLSVWRTALDQRRPYVALDDVVAALQFVVTAPLANVTLMNAVSETATVRSVVKILGGVVPGAATVTVDSPLMTTLSQEVSTARIRALGFRFRGTLHDGIVDTVARFQALNRSGQLRERP